MGDKPLFGFKPNTDASANASPFGAASNASNQPKSTFGGASGSSLFGGASGTPTTTSNLFGNVSSASPATSNTPTLFGSSTPNTTTGTGTTFGQSQTNASTPSTAPTSLFGNNTSTTGGFSFGPKPATSTTTASSLFGGAGATTAPPASTSTTNLFGNATAPESNSVFANGAKMPQASAGLFQNLGKQQESSTPQAKPASALTFTPAGKPPASTGAAGTSLFGATPAAPSTLFGAKPSGDKTPALSLGQNTGGKSLFGEVKPASEKPAAPLFGAPPATSQPAAPSSTNLFGNNLQKNDKPAAPSLFSNATTGASAAPSLSANATTSASATPSLFANATTSASAAPSLFANANTSATAAPSLFGAAGSSTTAAAAPSLFSATTSSAQSAAPTATSSAAPSGGLFGSAPSSAPASGLFGAGQTTTAAPTSTTATTAPSLGGLFGAAPSTSTATPAAAAAAAPTTSTAGASLFGASTGNPPAAASTMGNQQPSSRLASKSLDEIITTWSTSLAAHQKTFANVAERVAKWDRQLVQNSSAIGGLYSRVFQAERDTAEVERQLSNVEAGQRELDARLSHYETEVDRLLNAAGLGEDTTSGGVDNEREQTYNAAEDCQSRLTDMGQNLTAMIEEINLASNKLSTTKKANTSEDPLAQIVRVLNSHLAQLQAIDKGAQTLTLKVEQAQKDAGQLAGRNGVAGKQWIEGFGRSYLGRR